MSKQNDKNLNVEKISTGETENGEYNENNANNNSPISQKINEKTIEILPWDSEPICVENGNIDIFENDNNNYNNNDNDLVCNLGESAESNKEKEIVVKKFLKKKTEKNINNINIAFDKEKEKLEEQYCKKKPKIIKFTKRLRKKFKTYIYKKKSIKSFENSMIDFNKENYNNNNENNEFMSQNSNLIYQNLGSYSPTTNTGNESNEISLSEESTNFSLNNVEQNQNLIRYYCTFLNYPCYK